MKGILWRAFIALVWIFTLLLMHEAGFRSGVHARLNIDEAERKAQVECLKAMWGNPFSLEMHERVQSLSHDPEAVRAYLLDVLKAQGWTGDSGFIKTAKKLKVGEGVKDLEELSQIKPRAANLLALWAPGQTDIRKTQRPHWMTPEKAPLWDLYLTNPEAAWSRGAGDLGDGGK